MGLPAPGAKRRSAPYQLSLLHSDPARSSRHRLFFAVLPPTAAASSIGAATRHVRGVCRIRQSPLETSRLHVSLQGLGEHVECPTLLARYAIHVASKIALPRFVATFDRVLSFGGRSRTLRNYPLVLIGDNANGFIGLKRALASTLQLQARSSYTPHITLLYDERIIEERCIAPITWTVDEFALIHSMVKEPDGPRTPYSILGRWRLR